MILKGSQRGGARQLANHLLKVEENEHVEIHEISGFVSEDLDGALREIHAISQGTRCKQFMFSLSLNPPQFESVPSSYFEKALADIAKELKLEGQPRAIVFHEKEGRRHCHAVWSRIDTDAMKAINLPYFKMKLQDISRQLYFQYGWKMPRGLMNKEERNPLNFSLKEWQQAKRLKEDPKVIKQLFQGCWAVSDNKASFEKALNEYGYYLAKGDRRGFVAIDYRGEVYSLSRWMGVKTKDLKARLGHLEPLPNTKEVSTQISLRMSQKLETYIGQVQTSMNKSLEPFRQKKKALQNYHQTQRKDFQKKQEERCKEEATERYQNLPKGFKALWSRMSGKYRKIKAQSERKAEHCKIRDREEKQSLVDRQLTDRQNLQDQVQPIHRKHQKLIVQLKKDVAMYLAMGEPDQKTLQDKLTQMDQEERGQAKRGRNQGYDQEM
jgi:hypothetical protein